MSWKSPRPAPANGTSPSSGTATPPLGIPEYWRFDDSGGQHHSAPLAGDRTVDGTYQPIPIERLDAQTFQGYSAVLNLYLRWEQGQLGWYDPATGKHIIRFSDERARADAERQARIAADARADAERQARIAADARADAERQARIAADARRTRT